MADNDRWSNEVFERWVRVRARCWDPCEVGSLGEQRLSAAVARYRDSVGLPACRWLLTDPELTPLRPAIVRGLAA